MFSIANGAITKSLFRSECPESLRKNKIETLLGKSPYLTLCIGTRMTWRRRLYKVKKKVKKVSPLQELFIRFRVRSINSSNARSCIRSAFLLSDDLQKCHIKWQYVKCGKIKALYSNNLPKFLMPSFLVSAWTWQNV